MPRFAVVLSLLIMAAVGLPPFGLFFGNVEMLLRASPAFSWSLTIIALTWFLASWYLFRMMQRLLFGPHRADLRYEDLRANEVVYFAVLIVLLLLLGAAPRNFSSEALMSRQRIAMEMMQWRRWTERDSAKASGWSLKLSSTWQARSSPTTGRCALSCITIHCTVWKVCHLRKACGAANAGSVATGI
jgi:formate hydrogenlyase subunit 3/multisubunit Na+/H+ antiporter MnhD subunit